MIAPTKKQATALALRVKGLTWQQIAEELRTSRGNARLLAERARLKEYRLHEAAKEQ